VDKDGRGLRGQRARGVGWKKVGLRVERHNRGSVKDGMRRQRKVLRLGGSIGTEV
jgi:hypothetical protein